VYDFVRDLRAGRVPAVAATPPDAVRLLTVHGAKGLEARAVIVVDSDPEPRQPARATLLVDWPVDWPAPRRVAFLRSESQVPTALAELAAVESAQAQREELNGLYVAMSRAREWLVFSRTEPRPRVAEPSWWARCEPAAAPWQPEAADGRGPEALTATVAVPALPALHWQPDPQPRATVHDAAAARLGQAVHRVLEWIGQPGRPLAESEWPAAATAAATAFGVAPADAPRVLTVVQHILHSPQAARFFVDPGLRWAGNEVPVSDGGELLRIDRLVWLDSGDGAGAWWVIDFKLAAGVATLSGYRSQLGRYMAAVQALQPADAVRGAIVTGDGTVLSIP
jgi:ATP-dependent helicase/nuclease subunit A